MKVTSITVTPVSIPYLHREVSSVVQRDGVSDILVRVETDDGLVGWGESCSGADVESVAAAVRAMVPFVLGRSPWESESIRADLFHRGLWAFRKGTGGFAYAGIDMALWDLCGKAVGQPVYNLLGGSVRDSASYFYYLAQGPAEDVANQCMTGKGLGFTVFYLKVGIDIDAEVEMVAAVRETVGPGALIRLDANGAWSVAEAIRNMRRLAPFDIDFVEQPVMPDPVTRMQEVRSRSTIAICANEGMWSVEDSYRQITNRTADVFNFSPYWVGSLVQFQRLAYVAAFEGLAVSKHTHGELGLAASACHQAILTIPNLVEGNQQTAHMMADDILTESLPIVTGPDWPKPTGSGLCVEVDEDKVGRYADLYQRRGQFLPYDPVILSKGHA